MLKCLVDLKDHANVLCTKAQINGFNFETFEVIEIFITILDEYEKLHLKFQKKNTLLSAVIPSLLSLKKFLIQIEPFNSDLQELKTNLLADFTGRFQEMFDVLSLKFNLQYALSVYLDPSVKMLLNLNECSDLKIMVESHLNRIVNSERNDQVLPESNEYADLFTQLEVHDPNHNELRT